MLRKHIRIGNSYGITLDKKMLQDTGLSGLTYFWIEQDKKSQRIIIRKRRDGEW